MRFVAYILIFALSFVLALCLCGCDLGDETGQDEVIPPFEDDDDDVPDFDDDDDDNDDTPPADDDDDDDDDNDNDTTPDDDDDDDDDTTPDDDDDDDDDTTPDDDDDDDDDDTCDEHADCDDGLFCNGAEQCVVHMCINGTAPCSDDGVFCNGNESCNEVEDSCTHTGDPCTDNGIFCDGAESCNEGTDHCDHTGNPCADNGIYCDGTESCDEDNNECDHSGDPCESYEECDETHDECDLPSGCFWEYDFEGDTPAFAPGAPWQISAQGSSSATISGARTGSGNVLQIAGSTVEGDYVKAFYPWADPSLYALDFEFSFDFYANDGASAGGAIYQYDSSGSAYHKEVEFSINPAGSNQVTISMWDELGFGDWLECSSVGEESWHRVTIVMHVADKSASMKVDGNYTSCSYFDWEYGNGRPIAAFRVLDWGNSGLGGLVFFDNFCTEFP